MAKGIFPKHHWRELLAHLRAETSEFVDIEITQYGVIVDHTMVSFITDTDSDYEFKVLRTELLKTDTEELVTLDYEADQLSVICEVAGTLVRIPAVAL
jgi:hypothetical protein